MTETEAVAKTEKIEGVYTSVEAPKLSIRGETCVFQFNNKQLTLTDPAQIAELDNLIATRPNISAMVRKVDRAAALALAAKDLANRRGSLIKGPGTSVNMSPEVLALQRLHSNQGGPEMEAAIAELKEQGLEVTELSDKKPPHRMPEAGFIPESRVDEIATSVADNAIKLEDAMEPARPTDPEIDPAVTEGLKAKLGKKT